MFGLRTRSAAAPPGGGSGTEPPAATPSDDSESSDEAPVCPHPETLERGFEQQRKLAAASVCLPTLTPVLTEEDLPLLSRASSTSTVTKRRAESLGESAAPRKRIKRAASEQEGLSPTAGPDDDDSPAGLLEGLPANPIDDHSPGPVGDLPAGPFPNYPAGPTEDQPES